MITQTKVNYIRLIISLICIITLVFLLLAFISLYMNTPKRRKNVLEEHNTSKHINVSHGLNKQVTMLD